MNAPFKEAFVSSYCASWNVRTQNINPGSKVNHTKKLDQKTHDI